MQGPYLLYLDLSSSSMSSLSPLPAALSGDVANPSLAIPSSAALPAPLRNPGIDGIEGIAGIAGMAGIEGIVGIAALPSHPVIWDFTLENIPPALVGLLVRPHRKRRTVVKVMWTNTLIAIYYVVYSTIMVVNGWLV